MSRSEPVTLSIGLPVTNSNSSDHCRTTSDLGAITITLSTVKLSINSFAITEAQIVFPHPGAALIIKCLLLDL